MKILVSGGTGYVGRFIVNALRRAEHQVIAAGQEIPLDPDYDYAPLFKDIQIFIHCAFDHIPGRYRGGEGDDPDGFILKNRDGSITMLTAAKASGVSHAIFISSRAVYGDQPEGADLFETTTPNPNTLYGEIKLAVETALTELRADTFKTTSLRCTGVYDETKWKDLATDYLAGKPIAPRIGTEVHGDDVGQAVLCILENGSHNLFNVSDILIDRIDILTLIQNAHDCPHPLPERSNAARFNRMSSKRLRDLGWHPGGREKLEETIRKFLKQ